jgi:type IV pilus assembly protein PilY1
MKAGEQMTKTKSFLLSLGGACAIFAYVGIGATPVDVSAPREGVPPNIVTTANKPMVMLTASKDHTLFGPVYTDFEDLDGDGVIDTTFTPTFKYYGYFDATKCYAYESGTFVPKVLANKDVTTVNSVTKTSYTCSASQSYWSGNFLNWATMTRLDTVRKMLYGGYRSEDKDGSTILMGSRLVQDAHSFVKYYKGDDIRKYTPFTTDDLKKATGVNKGAYAGLSMCVTGSSEDPKASQPVMRLVKGNVRFWSTVEIKLCRWSDAPDNYNSGTFGPKLARFYGDVDKGNGGVKHEEKIPSRVNDGATYSGIGPDLNVNVKVCDPNLLGDERCQPFPADSTKNYKPYGLLQEFGYPSSSNSAARVEFGLITGSYDMNHTAGALRKNIRDLDDEINRNTGVFCHSASAGCSAKVDTRDTGKGAIKTFDSIILYGRNGTSYGSGKNPSGSPDGDLPAWGNPIGEMVVQALQYYAYNGSAPSPTNPSSTSNDSNAGLPVVKWEDTLANTDARAKYGNAICRPLNILAFSSNALSFDGQADIPFTTLSNRSGSLDSYVNNIGTAEGLAGSLRSVGSVSGKGLTTNDDKNSCSAKTIDKLSNVNGICPEAPAMGGTYQVAGAALYGNTSKIRTVSNPPSDLANVENALKVRTMAASLTGGSPRIDVPIPGTNPTKYVYITPESVQNNGAVSAPLTFASISSGPNNVKGMYGAFIVTWNDVLMGGDYDMDITGYVRYDTTPNPKSPSGWDISITTDIPGVCGGAAGTHGFSVIGVQNNGASANGRYLTHQHNSGGILANMPATSEYLCGDPTYRATKFGTNETYATTVCNVTGDGSVIFADNSKITLPSYCTVKNRDFLVTKTFNMVGETDALVKDPLWYAAKYGYFKSSEKLADGTYRTLSMPPDQSSWDSVGSDGTAGADGVPDGYFLARRPELLESQLRRVLEAVAKDSNAAPAVSSTQFTVGSFKYVAKFDSATSSGALEAYKVDDDGNVSTAYSWEAGMLLKTAAAGDRRKIITNSGGVGVPFRWNSLPAAYKEQMTTASVNKLSTDNAQVALNYVRGDQSQEGATALRQRGSTLLGPIINGSPWIQDRPRAFVVDDPKRSYAKYYNDNSARPKVLWVAANDGMLHAFKADTGVELLAYVPGALANRLAELPLQRGTSSRTKLNNANFTLGSSETVPSGTAWPYVDGNPFTADVQVDSGAEDPVWKTYAFSSLGRGGRAVFALDVTATDPSTFSEAGAANIFKWQFTSDDDADLGYITGEINIHTATNQPAPVVKLNNGKYALLLGNGNKSTNGKAALFILYMDGPTAGSWSGRYTKFVVDDGSGNGLSMPHWEDVDGNGTADVVYAGDLKGNMWKFDLSDPTGTKWGVAYKLFRAVQTTVNGNTTTITPLPITTAPRTMFMGRGGIMVMFGTGNAFETGDFPAAGVTQKVYGIWDRGSAIADDSTLVTRTYTRDSAGNVYLASGLELDWSKNNGWVMALPGSAEAVLSDPSLDAGVMTMVGVRPRTGTNQCSDTPNATMYTIDPISGRAERNVQGTMVVNANKVNIAGREIGDQKIKVVNDRSKKPFDKKCKAGDPNCACKGDKCEKPPTCGPGQLAKRAIGRNADAIMCYSTSPRMQWRDVPGLRTNQ